MIICLYQPKMINLSQKLKLLKPKRGNKVPSMANQKTKQITDLSQFKFHVLTMIQLKQWELICKDFKNYKKNNNKLILKNLGQFCQKSKNLTKLFQSISQAVNWPILKSF